MLHNYKKEIKYAQHLVAIDEDGHKYEGEFIDLRIDPETIPEGKYWYHCRHDDDGDWCTPVTIEPKVIVNFCGTLITDEPIKFPETYGDFVPLEEVYFN